MSVYVTALHWRRHLLHREVPATSGEPGDQVDTEIQLINQLCLCSFCRLRNAEILSRRCENIELVSFVPLTADSSAEISLSRALYSESSLMYPRCRDRFVSFCAVWSRASALSLFWRCASADSVAAWARINGSGTARSSITRVLSAVW